jgi:hypothetical protein
MDHFWRQKKLTTSTMGQHKGHLATAFYLGYSFLFFYFFSSCNYLEEWWDTPVIFFPGWLLLKQSREGIASEQREGAGAESNDSSGRLLLPQVSVQLGLGRMDHVSPSSHAGDRTAEYEEQQTRILSQWLNQHLSHGRFLASCPSKFASRHNQNAHNVTLVRACVSKDLDRAVRLASLT